MVSKTKQPRKRTLTTNTVRFVVNGINVELEIGDKPHQIETSHTLSYTLRETLGLTGTKISCDEGACGACTVIMDNKAVLSCKILTIECEGKSITTIEGLKDQKTGALHPLQQSFIDHTAFQCGFCTPGMIMASKALLDKNPSPYRRGGQGSALGKFLPMYQPLPGYQGRYVRGRKGGRKWEMTTDT